LNPVSIPRTSLTAPATRAGAGEPGVRPGVEDDDIAPRRGLALARRPGTGRALLTCAAHGV